MNLTQPFVGTDITERLVDQFLGEQGMLAPGDLDDTRQHLVRPDSQSRYFVVQAEEAVRQALQGSLEMNNGEAVTPPWPQVDTWISKDTYLNFVDVFGDGTVGDALAKIGWDEISVSTKTTYRDSSDRAYQQQRQGIATLVRSLLRQTMPRMASEVITEDVTIKAPRSDGGPDALYDIYRVDGSQRDINIKLPSANACAVRPIFWIRIDDTNTSVQIQTPTGETVRTLDSQQTTILTAGENQWL